MTQMTLTAMMKWIPISFEPFKCKGVSFNVLTTDMDRIQTKIGTVWEEKSAEGGDIADTYHDDA